MDEVRARYLRDRVMTASPAQRVVMLYDRLALDLRMARAESSDSDTDHVGHALSVVAELYGSLNTAAGGPADNLASIYTFLINELMSARSTGTSERLEAVETIVAQLREAWANAAEQLAVESTAASAVMTNRVLSRSG